MAEEAKTPQAATAAEMLGVATADGQVVGVTPMTMEDALKVFDTKEETK